ncbi:uncharacterized protein A4U43_C05F10780 [Asparagus officinalis]|uniref:Serine-threonine/tyrosine-protein kinase catalytic domain-containing protein n=1 Tax=Asparagus officinalis TaxID=4686 RepID=A0A5P1ER13_ASPOF|nr:uncharacterized protein A4U43_C05F10780 [Asparagus officinalis]
MHLHYRNDISANLKNPPFTLNAQSQGSATTTASPLPPPLSTALHPVAAAISATTSPGTELQHRRRRRLRRRAPATTNRRHRRGISRITIPELRIPHPSPGVSATRREGVLVVEMAAVAVWYSYWFRVGYCYRSALDNEALFRFGNLHLGSRFWACTVSYGRCNTCHNTSNGDFWLTIIIHGYLAPEYASSGKLAERPGVYSFGVVLLELITGRKLMVVRFYLHVSLLRSSPQEF